MIKVCFVDKYVFQNLIFKKRQFKEEGSKGEMALEVDRNNRSDTRHTYMYYSKFIFKKLNL